MFHNNWIVTSEAKEYRLKELGLFYSVEDEIDLSSSSQPFSYYGNLTAKFLTYDALDAEATVEEEEEALTTALLTAVALDRILILPEFKCHDLESMNQINHTNNDEDDEDDEDDEEKKKKEKMMMMKKEKMTCMLNHYWCLRQFDSQFKSYYREHSFLINPRVAKVIRDDFESTQRVDVSRLGFDMISFFNLL